MSRSLHKIIRSAISSLDGVKKAEARLSRAEDQVRATQVSLEKAQEKAGSVHFQLIYLEYSGTVFRLVIDRKSIAEQEWHYMAKVWIWNTRSRKLYRKGTTFYFHNVISKGTDDYALVARPVPINRHRQQDHWVEGGDAAFLIDQELLDSIEVVSEEEAAALIQQEIEDSWASA